jgi:hypothetical protein
MEAVGVSEMLISVYKTERYHDPEEYHLPLYRHWTLDIKKPLTVSRSFAKYINSVGIYIFTL